jgi:IS5 family transposase
MLRLHFLQHWFNLSDPAAEEALYDSISMRHFVGIDLGRERVPDETTILNFRHLLERHDLTQALFDRMNAYLSSRGLQVKGGQSSMRPSSPHRVRPRTRLRRVIQRCARPARAGSGISA